MASINGISLKKVTYFKDHEGARIAQGVVYKNNKKLGDWSQDSWGGCDRYDFDVNVLAQEVESFVKSDYVLDKYKEYADLDTLMYTLLFLMENEKTYKKGLKKGFKSFIVADSGIETTGYLYASDDRTVITKDLFYKKFEEDHPNARISIYCEPEDFDVVTGGAV